MRRVTRATKSKRNKAKDRSIGKDVVYTQIFHEISELEKNCDGRLPKSTYLRLVKKYRIHSFLNTKSIQRRYSRYIEKSKLYISL